MKQLNRRAFIKWNLAAAAGLSSSFSCLNGLRSAHAADLSGGYKALVCVYLAGGNDAFNMFLPRSTTEYNDYAAVRQHLAVPQTQLLPVSPATFSDGADYGFHPNMPAIQTLFNQGALAVIANVGTLVRPITKLEYENQLTEIPPQLFSHNDQTDLWMLGNANTSNGLGWAGSMMDLIYPNINTAPKPSPNLSIAGNNLWQSGNAFRPYEIHPDGIFPLSFPGHGGVYTLDQAYKDVYALGLGASGGHKMVSEHVRIQQRETQFSNLVGNALTNAPGFTQPFGGGALQQQLEMVAKLIAVRDQLDSTALRQVFFVQLGGWDTHASQNAAIATSHPNLLSQVSQSLDSFYAALTELGMENQVTTFTASEFGRSLTPNGDGTDHGWGGHSLVMGGAVTGNDIYGSMPQLSIDSADAVEEGRIIPTTSVDQYSATLAGWFGLTPSELNTLFPNLVNFSNADLGFMAS
jgi:uncharacterized protein (DUF1501 family)